MTEDTSKVIDRRKLRSMRMAAKTKTASKNDDEENPSAVAITTTTSTGIETSLPENGSKESMEETTEALALKKSKKKKKSSSLENSDSHKLPEKKSKKKKKTESVTDSIKSSASSPKKKKKKNSSSHKATTRKSKRKSKTKYQELDEDDDSEAEDKFTALASAFQCGGGKTASYETAEEVKKVSKASSSNTLPISASKSQSERDDSSLRDIKMATPVDSFSKRGSTSNRFKLGPLATFGSSSIDDDEIPFWRKSSRRNSPSSPTPSLEEDDTILTNDEDFLKLNRSISKDIKNRKPISPPPLSDDDDDSDESSSSEESSSDDEPEWMKKKKTYGQAVGEKVAYVPPPKVPESSPDAEEGKQSEEEEQESPKQNLPVWANARKSLKKTNSTRILIPSASIVKEKETKPEMQQKDEEQEPSKAGLPAWAQARRTSLKKTGMIDNTKTTVETENVTTSIHQNTQKISDKSDASTAGLPAWAQTRRVSLKKTGVTTNSTVPAISDGKINVNDANTQKNFEEKSDGPATGKPAWVQAGRTSLKKSGVKVNTTVPEKAAANNSDDKEKTTSNQSEQKESEQETLQASLPPWANARKSLKKSGSMRIVATPAPIEYTPLPTKSEQPENHTSDGRPPWAKARNSLKSSDSRRSLHVVPPEEISEPSEAEKDSSPVLTKAKTLQSPDGVPSWAKKKSSDDVGHDLGLKETPRSTKGQTGPPKSVKERLSLWGKPPRAKSERNIATTAVSSAESDVTTSRRTKLGKSQSDHSISGSVSVTSLGSHDSQGTNNSHSHRNRMAAYLENTRCNENKTDTNKPPIVPSESSQKNAKSSATPRVSNKHGVPARTASGNLSVKERMKAFGGSNHNVASRDGETSSIDTGGGISITDAENDEEKSIPSVKERMKAWNQSNTSNTTTDIPTKVAITKSSGQDEAGSNAPRSVSPFPTEENPNTKPDLVALSETDSYGRNKTKTWAAKPAPVPAYAAGRMALKKVKKDGPSSEEKERKLTRMYSSENLKKVAPPPEKKDHYNLPPSNHNPVANLKKVSPPVEKKWQSPKTDGDDGGKLYSSQHELLRRVNPPGNTVKESSIEAEIDVSELQNGNQALIMLISSTSGRHDQKTAQDRALTILKGMEISPDQMETVDGADPTKKERRDELFNISGIRGNYPQFFLIDCNEKITYMADWEGFESMHEMKILSESMNLASSSKYGGAESLQSSKDSFAEFAYEEASVNSTPNEPNDDIGKETAEPQANASETKEILSKGSELEALEDPQVPKTDNMIQTRAQEEDCVPTDESIMKAEIGDAEGPSEETSTVDRKESVELTSQTPTNRDEAVECNVRLGEGKDNCDEVAITANNNGSATETLKDSSELLSDKVVAAASGEDPAPSDDGVEAENDDEVSADAVATDNKNEANEPVGDVDLSKDDTNDSSDDEDMLNTDRDDTERGKSKDEKLMSNKDGSGIDEENAIECKPSEEKDGIETENSEHDAESLSNDGVIHDEKDNGNEVEVFGSKDEPHGASIDTPNEADETFEEEEIDESEDKAAKKNVESVDEQSTTNSTAAKETNVAVEEKDDVEKADSISNTDVRHSCEEKAEEPSTEENVGGEVGNISETSGSPKNDDDNAESDGTAPVPNDEENETAKPPEQVIKSPKHDGQEVTTDVDSGPGHTEVDISSPKEVISEEPFTEEGTAVEDKEDTDDADAEDVEVPVNFGEETENSVEKSNAELFKILEETGYLSNDGAKQSTALSSFLTGKDILHCSF